MSKLHLCCGCAALLAAMLAPDANAQLAQPANAQPAPQKPSAVKITIYPAAEPTPALKYQLLPPFIERRPGNAAVSYGKVKAEENVFFGDRKLQEKIYDWLEVPFDKFPLEEVQKEFHPPLTFLKLGARCETCDWDLPLREEKFYMIPVSEIQEARTFARLLALRARVHVAAHEYDKALEMIQAGYALGRHVAEHPSLIGGVVGQAIHDMMFDRLLELAQQPDAPNLYWAISALPRRMIDFRKGLEVEMYGLVLSFPKLRDLDRNDHLPAYWSRLLVKIYAEIAFETGARPTPSAENPAVLTTGMVLLGYPHARQWLIDQGRAAADVDDMPVAQVVLLYTMRRHERQGDDMFKWAFLPYAEARQGLVRSEEALRDFRDDPRETIPLAAMLLPAVVSVKTVEVRGERELAMLRVVEALRLYAAKHGRLPATLKEITEVPVPLDPTSNEPFAYHGNSRLTAVLELPGPEGTWRGDEQTVYEIELKQKP